MSLSVQLKSSHSQLNVLQGLTAFIVGKEIADVTLSTL